MKEKVENIKNEIIKKIEDINDSKILYELKQEYLGKKGKIQELVSVLGNLSLEEKKSFGPIINGLKNEMNELFENKAKQIGITKVRQTNNFIELTLSKELTNQVDGQQLFLETSKLSRMFRFKMTLGCLVVTLDIVKLEKHYIYYLLDFIKILEQSKK